MSNIDIPRNIELGVDLKTTLEIIDTSKPDILDSISTDSETNNYIHICHLISNTLIQLINVKNKFNLIHKANIKQSLQVGDYVYVMNNEMNNAVSFSQWRDHLVRYENNCLFNKKKKRIFSNYGIH